MHSEFAVELWARELGIESEVAVEQTNPSLNTRYGSNIFPQAGFQGLIPYKLTFDLPLSTERGDPRTTVGVLTSTSTTYDTVASLAVAARPRKGELLEVSLTASPLANTNWRLTIGGTQMFTGRVLLSALTLPFRTGFLAGAETILIEAASTDGTSITANASITLREFTPYEWQLSLIKKGQSSEEHTVNLTDDIIRNGIDAWVYVTKGSPFRLEFIKLYGRAGDGILIHLWCTKVPALANMDEIKKLAGMRGVQESLLGEIKEGIKALALAPAAVAAREVVEISAPPAPGRPPWR